MTDTRGFTAYVCVGPWGGIGLRRERLDCGSAYRLTLGYVAFCLATFDAERFIGIAGNAVRECLALRAELATGAERATYDG